MQEPAPAKINLFLHVLGRAENGYHVLDSLAVFAGAHDIITAAPSQTLSMVAEGPFAAGLSTGRDNLVMRAAQGLAAACNVPPEARLILTKNLPVASGIGGGSSDAAATIRVLCRLWGIQPRPSVLHSLAKSLGADVPVCLEPGPRRMGGVGDIVTTAPSLPPYGICLVNPGVAVATADVFRARTGPYGMEANLPPLFTDAGAMASRLSILSNDLEHAATTLCPEIGLALEALRATPGCLLARMSGSGATCFGLYETPTRAREAAAHCNWPGWWRWGGAAWGAT